MADTSHFLRLMLLNLFVTTVPAAEHLVWVLEVLRRTRVREVPHPFFATKKQNKNKQPTKKHTSVPYGTEKIKRRFGEAQKVERSSYSPQKLTTNIPLRSLILNLYL